MKSTTAKTVRPSQKMELLAPAGDFEKLKMAIQYGADAVYLGTRSFSLRSASANFDLDHGLPEAVAMAHQHGVKAFVAMNILAGPRDMTGLRQSIRAVGESGADALIVSDPGVFSIAREELPDIAMHISTQASVSNAQACLFWYRQGASRIVLARELSFADIHQIRSDLPEDLELEAFVHGAMCMAWSGRCLLSSHMNGRSANKGACTQTCRWKFKAQPQKHDACGQQLLLTEEKRSTDPLVMEEDERGSYIFNARDLCMIEHIPELAASGLNSLKIEGRTKSPFYVATVVIAYREALDTWFQNPDTYMADPEWLRDLSQTVHRPFDTGFYFQSPTDDAKIFEDDTMIREAAVVGMVKAWLPARKLMLVEQRNKILAGDRLELVQPRGRHIALTADVILDLEMNPIASTPHPQMLFYLPMPEHVTTGAFIRRSGDKDTPGFSQAESVVPLHVSKPCQSDSGPDDQSQTE